MLIKCRPTRDLTVEQEHFILDMLNDDWSKSIADGSPIHFHGPTCQCGGSRHYKLKVKAALDLLFSRGSPKCEMYRWKGYEQACCWCYRGTRCFGLLPACILIMYSRSDLDNAHRQLAEAGGAGDVNPGAAQTVRAGKVQQFFRDDPLGERVNTSIVCCAPQQRFVNLTFEAEKLSRQLIEKAAQQPANLAHAALFEQETRDLEKQSEGEG